jgi:hypothetical protein
LCAPLRPSSRRLPRHALKRYQSSCQQACADGLSVVRGGTRHLALGSESQLVFGNIRVVGPINFGERQDHSPCLQRFRKALRSTPQSYSRADAQFRKTPEAFHGFQTASPVPEQLLSQSCCCTVRAGSDSTRKWALNTATLRTSRRKLGPFSED